MSIVQDIADPNYVAHQYRDSTNLDARIRLHQEFSINKYGWQRWLFDQMKLMPNSHVLELGCGTGDLWLENIERIPTGLEITLSDISAGMLDQAQNSLDPSHKDFNYVVIDSQSIPFDDNYFDVVIANHMLHHVPNRIVALSEIIRILKSDGRFYASTVGSNHLKELCDLVTRFDPQLASWGRLPADSFTLENGSAQLGTFFSKVSLYRYPDGFVVTDADLLVDYILSGRITLSVEQRLSLEKCIEQELLIHDGKMYITKDSGLFELSDIL